MVPPNLSVTPSQYFPIPCRCTAKFGNEMALAQYFGSTGFSRDITGTLKGISCASSIAGGPVTERSPWHNHFKIILHLGSSIVLQAPLSVGTLQSSKIVTVFHGARNFNWLSCSNRHRWGVSVGSLAFVCFRSVVDGAVENN